MLDAVVLEYNQDINEAVVETLDASSKRYRVLMTSSAGLYRSTNIASEKNQVPYACKTKPRRAGYANHLLISTLLGRCVTIDPVEDINVITRNEQQKGAEQLPCARLVHLHESDTVTSKTTLPGIITRVSGRFVFIFCSFIPYEVVATRDMFSTGDFLFDPVSMSLATLTELAQTSEEKTVGGEHLWVGRTVQFTLYPASLLVMEAFFVCDVNPTGMKDEKMYPREVKTPYNSNTKSNNMWLPVCGVSNPLWDACGEPEVEHVEILGLVSENLGTWRITGTDPRRFFQPELSVQFVCGAMELPRNTMPPMMHQGSSFTIQLWCLWMLTGTRVSLHAIDEDQRDVTDCVLHIEEEEGEEASERTGLMLDQLESRNVVSLKGKIKPFKMQGVVCELTLVMHLQLGDQETRLESKPLIVRRNTKGTTASWDVPQKMDALSHKFWTTDLLGPMDNITGGFTDPGRSNQLLSKEESYEDMPMVEREIIVVDPGDAWLQSIASLARRTVLGIVDTFVCVQVLSWIVVSMYGGSNISESAEDEIVTFRRQRQTQKRCRKGSKFADGANVVRLGDIRVGLCRHRALLFKYLCDLVCVPCYLMRGEHQGSEDAISERHTWNIVPLEGRRHLLVDTTLSPHRLQVWPVSGYKSPQVELSVDWLKTHCLILPCSSSRIRLLEECGRGSTAVVRRGVLVGGLTCVVKLPRRSGDMEILVHEYGVLKTIRDSIHVVRCLGWSGGIVMEYFPTNLLSFMNHLIFREKRMSLSQQREVLCSILSALKDVHSRGYVHRDIKAENVLMVVIRCSSCHALGTVCHLCDVRAKLGDFADSVVVNATTQMHGPTQRVGTPPYTAPELEAEVSFSFAADIWSCGILAIEMAQMRLPFTDVEGGAMDGADGVSVIINGERLGPVHVPRLPSSPPPPRWQQEVVEGALQVDWRRRSSVKVLLDVLRDSAC